jgi:hypothetical protein
LRWWWIQRWQGARRRRRRRRRWRIWRIRRRQPRCHSAVPSNIVCRCVNAASYRAISGVKPKRAVAGRRATAAIVTNAVACQSDKIVVALAAGNLVPLAGWRRVGLRRGWRRRRRRRRWRHTRTWWWGRRLGRGRRGGRRPGGAHQNDFNRNHLVGSSQVQLDPRLIRRGCLTHGVLVIGAMFNDHRRRLNVDVLRLYLCSLFSQLLWRNRRRRSSRRCVVLCLSPRAEPAHSPSVRDVGLPIGKCAAAERVLVRGRSNHKRRVRLLRGDLFVCFTSPNHPPGGRRCWLQVRGMVPPSKEDAHRRDQPTAHQRRCRRRRRIGRVAYLDNLQEVVLVQETHGRVKVGSRVLRHALKPSDSSLLERPTVARGCKQWDVQELWIWRRRWWLFRCRG